MSNPVDAAVQAIGATPQAASEGASLAPLLRLVRPHRPDALIAPHAWDAIEVAGSSLPPTTEFGFECHFLSGGSSVDLVTRVSRTDGSASLLARRDPSSPLPKPAGADDFWPRIVELCARWCSPGTVPAFAFEALWLEYDANDLRQMLPQPSLAFLYVAAAAQQSLNDTVADAIARTLPMLAGGPTDDRLSDTIAGCVRALAPPSALCHFGLSLARGGSEIRVCFRLQSDALALGLAALGLAAMTPLVADILASVHPDCRVMLQVALTPEVSPRLGLEISAADPVGWRSILAFLLARNLCTQEEAASIVRWTSSPTELKGSFPWPPLGAGVLPHNPDAYAEGAAWRALSHVKLSVSMDQQMKAKVYLYAGVVWPNAIG